MKEFSFHYLSVLLALGSCLSGCNQPQNGEIVIAIDVSDQTESRLLKYADLAFKAQRKFATVTVIVYGRLADLVYEGQVIHDRSRFNQVIGRHFQSPREGVARPSTNHRVAITMAAKFASSESVLLVLTDGGEENPTDSMVKGVAELPTAVPVFIFGVLPEHRGRLIDCVKSHGGGSAVRSLADADLRLLAVETR